MTDEQIKQNAIKAAADFKDWHHPQMSFYDGYIAGAHSRDEEIEHKDAAIKELGKLCAEHLNENLILKTELDKLRNPWISVEKNPDDVTKDYLLEYEDGSHIVAIWDSGMWMSKNLHPLKEPTYWMPISEFKKGK